ncbi:MAG: transposase family protein [Treponema sp.]|jgi:transcription initiation factor TFIIIB Brf1 subunit/transcription initiation factor TFIIB|nr:transposase family protein [Treponema sp.]
MGIEREAQEAKDAIFKRLYRVKPETFEKMEAILKKAFDKLHKLGGRPPKMTVIQKLTATLKYLREYRTMKSIAADYGVAKSRISETARWVEDTLAKEKTFKLPGKRVLKNEGSPIKYIVVDVTESPINRPKKGQKRVLFGKKSGIR